MKIEDRIKGSLLSGALADAVGSEFENADHGTTYILEELKALSITDDTQLTLATCEAIIEAGHPDPEVIASHFLKVYQTQGIKGIGSSTLKALRDLEVGAHWYLAGNRSERSAGNGAAMRIAPIGFCTDILIDDLLFLIRDICSITHKNDEAYSGALSVALSIRHACEGGSLDTLPSELIETIPDTRVRDALQILCKVDELSILEASKITGTSGFVAESVPLAVFSAMKAETIGVLTMIQDIIYCGGDTDTNASIAAQIAGAYLGLNDHATELLNTITEIKFIKKVTDNFTQSIAQKQNSIFL